jgi:hypothetical protein
MVFYYNKRGITTSRGNKMLYKIAVLISGCFLGLGLIGCKNPEAPEEPKPNYEYRYNVEVIYTRLAVEKPESQDYVALSYDLEDPAALDWDPPQLRDSGTIEMNKIGENKYRCYLPKVFVQTPLHPDKHRVGVDDWKTEFGLKGESVDVQGAYDLEIWRADFTTFVHVRLKFRMSKE